MTYRDIEAAIGVSKSFVGEVMQLGTAPDLEKYAAKSKKGLRLFCRHALSVGREHDAVVKWVAENDASHHQPAPSAPAPASAPASVPEIPALPTGDRSADDELEELRNVLTATYNECCAQPSLSGLLNAYKNLHAEYRAAQDAHHKRQIADAQLIPRDSLHGSLATLYIEFRAVLDVIIQDLLNPANLVAWLSEHGTEVDDATALAIAIRPKLYRLISPRVNRLAAALKPCAAPYPETDTESRQACSDAFRAHLQELLAQLPPTTTLKGD